MEERIFLSGNKEQRIVQALKKAGWFPGRKVEIDSVLKYYAHNNIEISPKADDFIREFYGIARKWYIEVTNLQSGADFEFELFPYPKQYGINIKDFMYDDGEFTIESEEYKSVKDFAEENVVMVGEIGYYYPARVWIGDSGRIYCTHDYDDDIYVFNNVVQLIFNELQAHELESVAMKW